MGLVARGVAWARARGGARLGLGVGLGLGFSEHMHDFHA